MITFASRETTHETALRPCLGVHDRFLIRLPI